MTEQSTTITASEFVSEDYAAKVKQGECVVEEVLHDEDDNEKRYLVNNITPRKNNVFDVTYPWFTCVNVEPDKTFSVTWLPQAPAAPQAEGVAGDEDPEELGDVMAQVLSSVSSELDDAEDEIEALQAENNQLRALLTRCEPLIGMLPADSRWMQQIPLLEDIWKALGMDKKVTDEGD